MAEKISDHKLECDERLAHGVKKERWCHCACGHAKYYGYDNVILKAHAQHRKEVKARLAQGASGTWFAQ